MADLGQQPNRKRSRVFLATMTLAAVAAVGCLSACSQPSDSQPPTAQRQAAEEQARRDTDEKAWADAEKTGTAAAYMAYIQNFGGGAHVAQARQRVTEQTRKEADEKAWADAVRAGTAAAFTAYTQSFSSGAHVAEARERLAALDEQTRKEADEKAWTDALRVGTPATFTGYIQKFGSGAHVAEARQRATALETQGRKELPSIDIKNTCKAAAGAMVSLMGGTTTEQDVNACLDSEQKARDQIVKDRGTYSSADKKQCMRTGVYLPSYVEWLTCLEMERDVRKMERQPQFGTAPWRLPKVNPAINSAGR